MAAWTKTAKLEHMAHLRWIWIELIPSFDPEISIDFAWRTLSGFLEDPGTKDVEVKAMQKRVNDLWKFYINLN